MYTHVYAIDNVNYPVLVPMTNDVISSCLHVLMQYKDVHVHVKM